VTKENKEEIKRIIDSVNLKKAAPLDDVTEVEKNKIYNETKSEDEQYSIGGKLPESVKTAGLYAYVHVDPQSNVAEIRFPHNSPFRSELMNKKLQITVSPENNGIIIEMENLDKNVYGFYKFKDGSILVDELKNYIVLERGIKYDAFVEKLDEKAIALIFRKKMEYTVDHSVKLINPKTRYWKAKIKIKPKSIIVLLNKELLNTRLNLENYGYWYEIGENGLRLIGTKNTVGTGIAEDHDKYVEIILAAENNDVKLLGEPGEEFEANFVINEMKSFGIRPEIIVVKEQ
jgi:hypothetical protein